MINDNNLWQGVEDFFDILSHYLLFWNFRFKMKFYAAFFSFSIFVLDYDNNFISFDSSYSYHIFLRIKTERYYLNDHCKFNEINGLEMFHKWVNGVNIRVMRIPILFYLVVNFPALFLLPIIKDIFIVIPC